jgi:CubicO group peptidase (beta-lactamase class C family)
MASARSTTGRRRRSRAIGAIAMSLCLLAVVCGRPALGADAKPFDSGQVDRFVREAMAANGLPGLAVGITHGEEVVHLGAYGMAGDGRPMTTRTQMFIGSLSKSVTALAVMQLVESGQVRLDAPVRTYLPDFTIADAGAEITIAQLLHHTSGLADRGFPEMTRPQPDDLADRVAQMRDARLVAPPGTRFQYFNANYAVLARLVEVVSGLGFGAYLQRHVFAPLEMNDTTGVVAAQNARRAAPRLARGHIQVFGAAVARPEMHGIVAGEGGVISTVEDLANYLIMQNNGGAFHGRALLSPAGVSRMHTPAGGVDSTYGMGWMVTAPGEVRHNGVLSTFHADAALLADEGYGIVVLSNSYNALTGYSAITQGLIDLVTTGRAEPAGIGARTVGLILAALTAVTVGLFALGLRNADAWAHRRRRTSRLKVGIRTIWTVLPAVLLAVVPWLTALSTGRVFSYHALYRAMPSIMIWLTASAVLGLALGGWRVRALLRGGTPSLTSAQGTSRHAGITDEPGRYTT